MSKSERVNDRRSKGHACLTKVLAMALNEWAESRSARTAMSAFCRQSEWPPLAMSQPMRGNDDGGDLCPYAANVEGDSETTARSGRD